VYETAAVVAEETHFRQRTALLATPKAVVEKEMDEEARFRRKTALLAALEVVVVVAAAETSPLPVQRGCSVAVGY